MAGIAAKLAKDRQIAQGLGSNSKAVKYLNQDFHTLRNECLEAGKLFQDPSFPAAAPSLGYKELGPNSHKTKGIVWKRPTVGDHRADVGGREEGITRRRGRGGKKRKPNTILTSRFCPVRVGRRTTKGAD